MLGGHDFGAVVVLCNSMIVAIGLFAIITGEDLGPRKDLIAEGTLLDHDSTTIFSYSALQVLADAPVIPYIQSNYKLLVRARSVPRLASMPDISDIDKECLHGHRDSP